jgi:hypothetical protein
LFELVLTILGVVLGFGLSTAYEHSKGKKARQNVRTLLSREICSNIEALKEQLSIIENYSVPDLPSFIEPLTIKEIANRIESSVLSDSFDSCRLEVPLLGDTTAEAIFDFYESARFAPQSLREIERWVGNIRYGLFEDTIHGLIGRAEKAVRSLNAQPKVPADAAEPRR